MKIYKPLFLILIFSAFFMLEGNAQKRNFTQEADESFEDQQYYTAIDKYKKAYSKVKGNRVEKKRIMFQIAECYRLTNNPKRAESQYKRLVRIKYEKQNPLVLLYYAEALKANSKFDLAKIHFDKYAVLKPEDKRGVYGSESCDLTRKWIENPTRYVVQNIKKLNSRSDDFAPAYADKKFKSLIFTSAREGSTGNRIDDWTGQNFSDLYYTKQDRKGDWSAPNLADEDYMVNSEGNEGIASFNGRYSTMYFTRCGVEKKKRLKCQVYKSNKKGRGWGEPELVVLGKDSSATYGHPFISADELTIYFASDMEGGKGGKDIWISTRERKSKPFGRAKNLGSVINTVGDEMFPTLRNDSMLYFSSNGLPGMGGLDIFKTLKKNGEWSKPVNMKFPVNTNKDDFGITFDGNKEEAGFLSSNRDRDSDEKKSRGGDDIFSFYERPLLYTIAGVVSDDRTMLYISGAKIVLTGTDGTSIETLTDSRGFYKFDNKQILKNTSYDLEVSKENYFNSTGKETTVGLTESKDFILNFILVPIPDKPIPLPEILYDLAKWDLKPQYQDSLIDLIQTLENNPKLVIELQSHTDARDTDIKNDTLSQRRAQSVVDYLIVRGIDSRRLVAKGYGERVPRTLLRTMTKDGYTFSAGTVLTEPYINSLSSRREKEAAHQLNRRTEFRILSKDFVPTSDSADAEQINIVYNPYENIVEIIPMEGDAFSGPCIIDGYNKTFVYDKQTQTLNIALEDALNLLKVGAISKEDFIGDPSEVMKGGSIADQAVFKVKTLRIGDNIVTDLEATVVHDLQHSITLGDEILSKFGTYTLDKENNKIIFR